ncbi:hypothetical protein K4K58_003534 [Colletotrichum sp. SAR11_239]|nr:hypothetical protein K4K58_003534 [Colletotrichum sp. SAR11_239]
MVEIMPKKNKAARAAGTAKARAALADKKRKEREGEEEEGGGTPPVPSPEPEGPEPKKAKTNEPSKGKKPAEGGGAEEGRDSESATPAPPSARKPRQGRKQKALKAEGREEEQLPPLGDTVCLLCLRSAISGMSLGVCAPGLGQGGKCAPCKEKRKPCVLAPVSVSGPGLRFLGGMREDLAENVLARRRTALREALDAYDEAEAKAKAKAKAEGESGDGAAAEPAAPLPVPAIAPSVELAVEDAQVSGGSRAGPSSEATPSVSEAAGIRAAIDSFVGKYLPKEIMPAYEVLIDNYASALRGRK